MHRHGDPKDASRSAEREANTFASAFLMPENDITSRMPRTVSIDVILKAKLRWRVSAMAMSYSNGCKIGGTRAGQAGRKRPLT
jgi:Zn-dependent peptidase ImmA (M78 family)